MFKFYWHIRGLFCFQGPIAREIKTTVRIRRSFVQMCCAMSLVWPPIATHHTYQFWVCSDPVNMPKTIESPAKCRVCVVICFFIKKKWRGMLSSGIVFLHDNARLHTAAATKRLLKRFRFCLDLGSLWFSSLSSYETVVGGQHLDTMSCRPA